MSSSRLCSLSVWIMSVDCKNTRQAVVVKLSKEINHTAFKYMQVKYTQDYWLHSYDVIDFLRTWKFSSYWTWIRFIYCELLWSSITRKLCIFACWKYLFGKAVTYDPELIVILHQSLFWLCTSACFVDAVQFCLSSGRLWLSKIVTMQTI